MRWTFKRQMRSPVPFKRWCAICYTVSKTEEEDTFGDWFCDTCASDLNLIEAFIWLKGHSGEEVSQLLLYMKADLLRMEAKLDGLG